MRDFLRPLQGEDPPDEDSPFNPCPISHRLNLGRFDFWPCLLSPPNMPPLRPPPPLSPPPPKKLLVVLGLRDDDDDPSSSPPPQLPRFCPPTPLSPLLTSLRWENGFRLTLRFVSSSAFSLSYSPSSYFLFRASSAYWRSRSGSSTRPKVANEMRNSSDNKGRGRVDTSMSNSDRDQSRRWGRRAIRERRSRDWGGGSPRQSPSSSSSLL